MKRLNNELINMLNNSENSSINNYINTGTSNDNTTQTNTIGTDTCNTHNSDQNNLDIKLDLTSLIDRYQNHHSDNIKNNIFNKIPIDGDGKKFIINKNIPIDIIDKPLNNINHLIELGKLYEMHDYENKNYSVNIKGINKMIPVLKEFDSLIGLDAIKERILDQIIFFSQDLHNNYLNDKSTSSDDNHDMFHTIIEGTPGVGKTILGKILSKIYLALGITNNDTFKIIKRSDLIAEYLGQTAIKTQKVIDSVTGGVLFIDEAYSLGNDNNTDSYSKECLDVLNQNLSENKSKFICIIAGYPEDLENNFFSANKGLKRRFAFKYSIEKYSWLELTQILISKINKDTSSGKWIINDDTHEWLLKSEFINKHLDKFPNFGGDIDTLFLNIKICHARRVFGKSFEIHKIINKDDIENGLDRYLLLHRNDDNETLSKKMMYS